MAYCIDYAMCTICGSKVGGPSGLKGWSPHDHWDPRDWMARGLLLSGPHWWFFRGGPKSMTIPDETVTLERACATWHRMEVYKMPQREEIFIQCEDDVQGEENRGTDADSRWRLLVHSTCEEIARRVMELSRQASILGIGDLWMTLDQRCAKAWGDPDYSIGTALLPKVPVSRPGYPLKLGLGGYYIPENALPGEDTNVFEPTAQWWDVDPLHIPGLTGALLANLEHYTEVAGTSSFTQRLLSLPEEIKQQIAAFLPIEPISLECNYLMSQAYWKQALLSIPFLWDLEISLVDEKTSQPLTNTGWDWEKMARQVMSRVEMVDETNCENPDIWSYAKVGLDVPPGLHNRRRIWQIVEDMYPNDVQHVQPDWENDG